MRKEKRCEHCEYFDIVNDFCRANPPSIANYDVSVTEGIGPIDAIWPVVNKADWCGAFQWREDNERMP